MPDSPAKSFDAFGDIPPSDREAVLCFLTVSSLKPIGAEDILDNLWLSLNLKYSLRNRAN